jgi:predicted extracellular nuclease
MFYNVENLFDTRNDSTVNDDDFLPASRKSWTRERYQAKISNLYKTIVACGQGKAPDVIGLCEIENDYCLKSLVLSSPLSMYEYRFVHFDSPDPRGIDVAMLYNPRTFKLITSRAVPVKKNGKRIRTRDILVVKGVVLPSDTLFVCINHWPSRRGGVEESEEKRVNVALQLRGLIDSIMKRETRAFVVAMGDFNDNPTDRSILQDLGAGPCSLGNTSLCNAACWYTYNGTYKFRGDWQTFDQCIISRNILNFYKKTTSRVCALPFLVEEDESYGGYKPFKTYSGMKYLGGISDHLPVILHLAK